MSQLSVLRDIATFLGINTEDKSAEDLTTLIKEATAKKPPAHASNVIDHNALSKHFEEGRFTDCTIRVKIGDASADASSIRPAKRLKSGSGEASGAEEAAAEAGDLRVINAHALVLASRSAYFERAMGGEWRESKDRSFEVEVADETEYATFRHLIKMCYGTTFIKEGDRELDSSELGRLIHVANAFECMDAVKECATALIDRDPNWEVAVQCIELTDMLKGVEGMEDLGVKAGDVLAKEVGPVHKLFTPAKDGEDEGDVLGGLKLSEKVKDLSPTVFEALLSSKGLQLKTANEAFWLLLAWVEAQSEESEEGKQALFNRMAKHLHFDGMDPGYILLLVSKHPRIIAAGLENQALRASLIHANLARRTHDDVDGFYLRTTGFYAPGTRTERCPWPCGKATWTLDVSFNAADATAATSGQECRKVAGLVAGLPWYVELEHWVCTGHEVSVSTMCDLPFNWMTFGNSSGFFFHYNVEAALGTPRTKTFSRHSSERTWTESDSVGGSFSTWDDVFREGSEWLVDGELRVRVTVTIINDQGP